MELSNHLHKDPLGILDTGYWICDDASDIGYWALDIGYWILDIGYRILDIGHWISDIGHGYLILDIGHWILVGHSAFCAVVGWMFLV